MLLYISKPLFVQTIGFWAVRAMHHMEHFCCATSRILKERFGKDCHISRTEAEHLAEMVNLQPEQVLGWFKRQRRRGTVAYKQLNETLV